MKVAPIPKNDQLRLEALKDLGIIDTPPEERFNRIIRLSKHYFNVPMVAISLIDENRQWFKSRIGFKAAETARDISFCGHTIHSEKMFIVRDAQKDERFADNPLVTGEPYIRFYAGIPVKEGSGQIIGTLCILDNNSRKMTKIEQEALKDFAAWVEMEINSTRLSNALDHIKQKNEELSRLNNLMVNREIKMMELKQEIKHLREEISPHENNTQKS